MCASSATSHAEGCEFVITRRNGLEMGHWRCVPGCPASALRRRRLTDPAAQIEAGMRYMRERYGARWGSWRG